MFQELGNGPSQNGVKTMLNHLLKSYNYAAAFQRSEARGGWGNSIKANHKTQVARVAAMFAGATEAQLTRALLTAPINYKPPK